MVNEQYITEVYWPVLEKVIQDIDCIENRDVVDENLQERFIQKGFTDKCGWKGLCMECK